ncbi:MAG: hypothetical protein GY765_08170 [bacterium]|nr:hypothetical protein [bacterium]
MWKVLACPLFVPGLHADGKYWPVSFLSRACMLKKSPRGQAGVRPTLFLLTLAQPGVALRSFVAPCAIFHRLAGAWLDIAQFFTVLRGAWRDIAQFFTVLRGIWLDIAQFFTVLRGIWLDIAQPVAVLWGYGVTLRSLWPSCGQSIGLSPKDSQQTIPIFILEAKTGTVHLFFNFLKKSPCQGRRFMIRAPLPESGVPLVN